MDGLTLFAIVLLVSCPLIVGVGWIISQNRGVPSAGSPDEDAGSPDDDRGA